ncbi:MAG: BrnA antitoxin family protein [Duganella sp.]
MSKRTRQNIDPEVIEFEAALLRSLDQAAAGEGRVTTPENIVARRGRPVGSIKARPKVPTTIRFDEDILVALKASGRGWQTRVNEVLREWLSRQSNTN